MEGLGRLPEAERWDQTGWQDLKGLPWDLRPTGVPAPEVEVEAQPGAAEAERRERRSQSRPRERALPLRPRDERALPQREAQEKRVKAAAASASDAAETIQPSKRMRDFYVVRRDVDKFCPTAKCTGCTNASMGIISGRHAAHNDECRNRFVKLLTDESSQRVESFFDRTRVQGDASSGAPTVVMDESQ